MVHFMLLSNEKVFCLKLFGYVLEQPASGTQIKIWDSKFLAPHFNVIRKVIGDFTYNQSLHWDYSHIEKVVRNLHF